MKDRHPVRLSEEMRCPSKFLLATFVKQVDLDDLSQLSIEEYEFWNSEKKQRRNCMDWLAGRIAAKLSTIQYVEEQLQSKISATDIIINNMTTGAPFVKWDMAEKVPNVSIAHRGGSGLAVLAPHGIFVGCDMELRKERSIDIISYFSTGREFKRWVEVILEETETLTCLWASKESVIKCLKSSGNFRGISIDEIQLIPNEDCGFRFNYRDVNGLGFWWKDETHVFAMSIITDQIMVPI